MTAYQRSYLKNLGLVGILLAIAIPQFILAYTATCHGEPLVLADHLIYSGWVIVLVMTLATGCEVVRDAWRHDIREAKEEFEEYLASVMPPLFEEAYVQN